MPQLGLNQPFPLQQLTIEVSVQEESYCVTTTQRWQNPLAQAVEIHYTLPLPRNAVLLELRGQLGEQILSARVQAKAVAEQRYEQAMSEGHSAFQLQRLEDGLWGLSLGNLAAGEAFTLTYRWIHWSLWQGRQLRLFIPTTIAPKYGHSTVSPEFIPAVSLTASVPLDCRLTCDPTAPSLQGVWSSPSHPLQFEEYGCRLADSAEPDRDLIFILEANQPPTNHLLAIRDGEQGYFQIGYWVLPEPEQPLPSLLDEPLWLVVDCSGSMAGESIRTAKQALQQIISQLPEGELINLLAFGSTAQPFARQPLRVSPAWRQAATRWVEKLEADLGGTELDLAFQLIFQQQQQRRSRMVLLTDGEVSGEQRLIQQLQSQPVRCYTIGIGSAVSESLVRGLAEASGGICELVNPREAMAETIQRQTHRACQPVQPGVLRPLVDESASSQTAPLPQLRTLWKEGQRPQTLLLHAGQPLQVIHALSQLPTQWQLTLADGSVLLLAQPSEVNESPDLQRLAAASFSHRWSKSERAQWDEHYQLMGPETHWIAVLQRQEAIDTLPLTLRQPHLLAAGYGGLSSVDPMDVPAFLRRSPSTPMPSPGVVMYSMSLPASSKRSSRSSQSSRNSVPDLAPPIMQSFKESSDESNWPKAESGIVDWVKNKLDPNPRSAQMTRLLHQIEQWLTSHSRLTKAELGQQLAEELYARWLQEAIPPLDELKQAEIESMQRDLSAFAVVLRRWIEESGIATRSIPWLVRLLQWIQTSRPVNGGAE